VSPNKFNTTVHEIKREQPSTIRDNRTKLKDIFGSGVKIINNTLRIKFENYSIQVQQMMDNRPLTSCSSTNMIGEGLSVIARTKSQTCL